MAGDRIRSAAEKLSANKMSIITDVIESTKAIIQGMGVTLSYIPKRKWTVQYPDEPVTVQPRYRGQHLLHVDELGREKCVACYLCAAACPSECIYIVADDPRPAEQRIGVDERYASVYNIDYGRCIFADTASRLARKMRSRTGTILSFQCTVAQISSRPKMIC